MSTSRPVEGHDAFVASSRHSSTRSLSSQQRLLRRSARARTVLAAGGPARRGPRSQSPQALNVSRAPPGHALGPPTYRARHGVHRPATRRLGASAPGEDVRINEDEDHSRAVMSESSVCAERAVDVTAPAVDLRDSRAESKPTASTPREPSSPHLHSVLAGSVRNEQQPSAVAAQDVASPARLSSQSHTWSRPQRFSVPAPSQLTMLTESDSESTERRDDKARNDRAAARAHEREQKRAERAWIQQHLPCVRTEGKRAKRSEKRREVFESSPSFSSDSSSSRSSSSSSSLVTSSASQSLVPRSDYEAIGSALSSVEVPRPNRTRHASKSRPQRLSDRDLMNHLQQLYEAVPSRAGNARDHHIGTGSGVVVDQASREDDALTVITVMLCRTHGGEALIVRMYVETNALAELTIADVKTEVERRVWVPREVQKLRVGDPHGIVLDDSLPLLFLPLGPQSVLFMDPTDLGDATTAAFARANRSPHVEEEHTQEHTLAFRVPRRSRDEGDTANGEADIQAQIARARAVLTRMQTEAPSTTTAGSVPSYSSPSWSRGVVTTPQSRSDENTRGRLHSPRQDRHRVLRSPPREDTARLSVSTSRHAEHSPHHRQPNEAGKQKKNKKTKQNTRHSQPLSMTSSAVRREESSAASDPRASSSSSQQKTLTRQQQNELSSFVRDHVQDLYVGHGAGFSSDSSRTSSASGPSLTSSMPSAVANVSSIRAGSKPLQDRSWQRDGEESRIVLGLSENGGVGAGNGHSSSRLHHTAHAHNMNEARLPPLPLPTPPAAPNHSRMALASLASVHTASPCHRSEGDSSTGSSASHASSPSASSSSSRRASADPRSRQYRHRTRAASDAARGSRRIDKDGAPQDKPRHRRHSHRRHRRSAAPRSEDVPLGYVDPAWTQQGGVREQDLLKL